MAGGKSGAAAAVLHVDEYSAKIIIVMSIFITSIVTLAIIALYCHIRDCQQQRDEHFEESSQMDQIDYLIGLLEQQEKLLKMDEMKKGSNRNINLEFAQKNLNREFSQKDLGRYLELHKEFSSQLDGLHQMMVGMSKKKFDEEVRGKRKG